ncbi:hypothetical protein [Paracidovorax valerianellae]|uniref:Uncharacterized protein n=1 Tax=Paracidovorax valerianellae TaxID=187868 RepID=A0A1G7FPQ7_9BURK|nr:hypothetical protein [Paracidovorax valerianellae]MDA8443812.1 hypothetical protein [Paracidovorax valerianellae]SDE77854.1 hypothetical protein SAMN05192589_1401 [Paracidovorax valerianellae]
MNNAKNILIMLLVAVIPIFSPAQLIDKNACAAIFAEKYVAAEFPIPAKKEWHWFRRAVTPERPEHAWIAEPGIIESDVFKGNGVAFSMSIGSANLSDKKEQKGSMADLIISAKKNAYLTKKNKTSIEEGKNFDLIMKSEVAAKLVEEDVFMLSVFDSATVGLAKSGNPTHMRLRAISSSVDSTYECIPKIEYLKILN